MAGSTDVRVKKSDIIVGYCTGTDTCQLLRNAIELKSALLEARSGSREKKKRAQEVQIKS